MGAGYLKSSQHVFWRLWQSITHWLAAAGVVTPKLLAAKKVGIGDSADGKVVTGLS